MGTLHTVTLICLLPMYSGCSRYCFVLIQLLLDNLVASSCEGSRISQVAKLRLQKYIAGIPAAFKISSNFSFLSPASLLVFMSETIKDRVFGWTASTSSRICRIRFPLKYWAYFPPCPFCNLVLFFYLPASTRRLVLTALFELAELYSPSLMFPGRPQAMTAILVCLGIKNILLCFWRVRFSHSCFRQLGRNKIVWFLLKNVNMVTNGETVNAVI